MEDENSDSARRDEVPGPLRLAVATMLAHAAARLLRAPGGSPSTEPVGRSERRSRRDRVEEMVLWATIAVLGIAAALGLAWFASIGLGVVGFDRDHDLMFRLCLSVLMPVPVFVLARPTWERLRTRFWTTWWDPSTACADGPIGWGDVLRMAAGGGPGDALTSREHLRRSRLRWRVVPYALCLSSALFAAAIVIDGLLIWRLPSVFGSLSKPPSTLLEATANVSGNLTAYLALLAAAVSIVFTYRQLRAKVRADNRQAWIDRARTLLSDLAQKPETAMDSPQAEKLARSRMELELMLNPSEKDHRFLIYLLQRLHLQAHADEIDGAKTLLSVIRADMSSGSSAHAGDWLGSIGQSRPDLLVGYVVRLSHVVLKREWERVKHTR